MDGLPPAYHTPADKTMIYVIPGRKTAPKMPTSRRSWHLWRERYAKTLALLEIDPFHPSLRLHALQGRLTGLHSVSINLQYRITLELELRGGEIILVSVGSHGEVY